jgi:hypothetical protein
MIPAIAAVRHSIRYSSIHRREYYYINSVFAVCLRVRNYSACTAFRPSACTAFRPSRPFGRHLFFFEAVSVQSPPPHVPDVYYIGDWFLSLKPLRLLLTT